MTCKEHETLLYRGNFSRAIDVVSDYIISMGFELYRFPSELTDNEVFCDGDFRGRVDYRQKIVAIDEGCCVCALMTLLHEAGHVTHYCSGPNDQPMCKGVREGMAILLGNYLIRKRELRNLLSIGDWVRFSFDQRLLNKNSEERESYENPTYEI